MRKILSGAGILICVSMILVSSYGILRPSRQLFSSFDPNKGAPYRLVYNEGRIALYRRWDISPYMEWSSSAAPFLVRYYTSLEDVARDASILSDKDLETFFSNS